MMTDTKESPKVLRPYKAGDTIFTLAALGSYMEVSEESGVLSIEETTKVLGNSLEEVDQQTLEFPRIRRFYIRVIGGRHMSLKTIGPVHLNSESSGLEDFKDTVSVHYFNSPSLH